jgi:anti-repressor protein
MIGKYRTERTMHMNEIIKIDNDNKVSGRELHEFLEVGTAYKDWFPRMAEYGFVEGTDFCSKMSESTGGRPALDHRMTIEMAKEICMLQRTDRGKQARQYFIQVENDWNSPDKIMARALVMSQKLLDTTRLELAQSKQIINELQPKASYYDLILQSKSVMSVSKIAKDFGKSAVWLNRKLEEKKVQYSQGGVWLLYQKYAEKGYTQSTSHVIDDEHSRLLTKWTQKGRLFIYELLKGDGILPLIEQTETV